jgi:hypothetical protein
MPVDDDSVPNDALSDSNTSQHTIPDVPNSARNRSGSLTSFNKNLTKYISILEDNPNSGTSPPHSIRDPGTPSSSSAGMLRHGTSANSLFSYPLSPSTGLPSPHTTTSRTNAPDHSSEAELATTLTIIKNRIAALEWLISTIVTDRLVIFTLDQLIRNRDLCDNRRPYERLVHLFVDPLELESLASPCLDLINILLPEIAPSRRAEFFEVFESSSYINNLTKLLKSDQVVNRLIATTFQRLYVEHLLWQARMSWDPRDPRLSNKMVQFMKHCEPIHCFPPVVWENCSRIAFVSCCYLAEHYPSVIRKLLDENEAQTPDTYCLPLIASLITQNLNELILANAPAALPRSQSGSSIEKSSTTNSIDSAHSKSHDDKDKGIVNPSGSEASSSSNLPKLTKTTHVTMMSILFSQEDSYYELFAMTVIVFDTVWKETRGTLEKTEEILAKTRHLISISCEANDSITSLKSHLMLTKRLSPAKTSPSSRPAPHLGATQASSSSSSGIGQSMSSLPSFAPLQSPNTSPQHHHHHQNQQSNNQPIYHPWRTPKAPMNSAEMRLYFVELVRWISTPMEKASLQLLADAVGAMRTLAMQPNFPWEAATENLLFHLLRNIGGSDGHWIRQPHLSSQVALWIDYQLNTDPRGPFKLVDSLEMIAADHSEGYCHTKPLVRMLRNNRQLSVPLRIINRLFEHKQDEVERKTYITDLAQSQALSIMKSKVWSTFAEVKHELLRFQANLLSLHQTKFDPNLREHESILSECWTRAFPMLRVKHVGPIQWALLGFRKATSITAFRGTRLIGFQHLLHFTKTHTSQVQHLILCSHPTSISMGDCACALSSVLLRLLTSHEYLMPMIFDEDRDGFAEIHAIAMLWMIQAWLIDPSVNAEHLVHKTESHIVSVMKQNKANTSEEFTSHMGVSTDLINTGWAKLIERQHNANQKTNTSSSSSSLSSSAAATTTTTTNTTNTGGGVSPLTLSSSSSSRYLGIHEPNPPASPLPTSNSVAKLKKMLGTENGEGGQGDSTLPIGFVGSPSSIASEVDYIQEYLDEHRSEFMQRETDLANYIDSHSRDAKKGRQRGSSRAERELAETERLSRTKAASRIALAIEPITAAPDDEKHLKEIIKQRKAEAKEQKELKTTLAKLKPFRV